MIIVYSNNFGMHAWVLRAQLLQRWNDSFKGPQFLTLLTLRSLLRVYTCNYMCQSYSDIFMTRSCGSQQSVLGFGKAARQILYRVKCQVFMILSLNCTACAVFFQVPSTNTPEEMGLGPVPRIFGTRILQVQASLHVSGDMGRCWCESEPNKDASCCCRPSPNFMQILDSRCLSELCRSSIVQAFNLRFVPANACKWKRMKRPVTHIGTGLPWSRSGRQEELPGRYWGSCGTRPHERRHLQTKQAAWFVQMDSVLKFPWADRT